MPQKPEAAFESKILATAKAFGWLRHGERAAYVKSGDRINTPIKGDKGWPDLVLVHPVAHIAVFRELKVPPGKTTPEQDAWLAALRAAGLDAAVWTPADWPEIVRVLSFGRAHDSQTWRRRL